MVPTVGEGRPGLTGDLGNPRGSTGELWGGAGYSRVDENPLERGMRAGMREKALERSHRNHKILPTTTSTTLVVATVIVTGISLHAVVKNKFRDLKVTFPERDSPQGWFLL